MSRSVFGRREFLLSLGAAGTGFALSRCVEPPGAKKTPPAGATSQAATSQASPAKAHAATQAVSQQATQAAASAPGYQCPDLGKELFPRADGLPLASAADCPTIIIPRDEWTDLPPDRSRINLMNGIGLMTIHHSGFTKPWEEDRWRGTLDMVQYIRGFQSGNAPGQRGWADIAYHFVIDRAGRVWQGRPLVYQGAHVKGHNEHNLGICMLGNFDMQRPSAAQCVALATFVRFIRSVYLIPTDRIYTHGELGTTACPGKQLQAFVSRERPSWT